MPATTLTNSRRSENRVEINARRETRRAKRSTNWAIATIGAIALAGGMPAVLPAEASEKIAVAHEDTWNEVRNALAVAGFSPEPGVRQALKRWQSTKGYPSTGFLNSLQYQELMEDRRKIIEKSNRSQRFISIDTPQL